MGRAGTRYGKKLLINCGRKRALPLAPSGKGLSLSQGLRDNTGPLGLDGKASACSAGNPGSIPGLGRSPGEGNGNPLQYFCLENSMDLGAWWATVHGVAKSRTRLSNFTFFLHHLQKPKALPQVVAWGFLQTRFPVTSP